MTDETTPGPTERIGLWAPGRYYCKCMECGDQFKGDKRSVVCLRCAKKWQEHP